MAGDDQLIEVDRLLVVERVQTEIVEDQRVGAEEGVEGLVDGVVDVGLDHLAELAVGGLEADRETGARRRS